MIQSRAGARSRAPRRIPTFVLLAAVSLLAFAGCSGDATRPGASDDGIPQATFDAQLDPARSTFVLERATATQPDGRPVEVELIGSNLVVADDSNELVSLDVSLRNVSRIELFSPALVLLGGFVPASVEVLNADLPPQPPGEDDGDSTDPDGSNTGSARYGFDYSPLLGQDGILSPGETSGSRTWEFRAPNLQSFSFAAVASFGGNPPSDQATISGLVFHDLDGDGVRDRDEPPFTARMTLEHPDGTAIAINTNDRGQYRFEVRSTGLHAVTLNPPELGCPCELVVTTSNPLQVVVLPGPDGRPTSYEHADFGVRIVGHTDVPPVVLTDRSPDEIRQDDYWLGDIELTRDVLKLRVGFSGCSPDHAFPLYMSGGFLESEPVQARLVLGHDDHGEACDAAFERTLYFDLRPIREAYERMYGHPGVVILRLIDPRGDEHQVRYVWGPPVDPNHPPEG